MVVNRLFEENRAGQSVTVELRPPNGTVGEIRAARLPERITVRFVAVRLSTGELEVLATNLLDQMVYGTAAWGELYHYRGGIETCYGLLKGRLDWENFTGRSPEAVRQDVWLCGRICGSKWHSARCRWAHQLRPSVPHWHTHNGGR